MEYNIVKFFHVFGIVVWIGALMYSTRLLAFHSEFVSKDYEEKLNAFERKGYFFVQLPGMATTIISGILLIVMNPYIIQGSGWFHAKALFVVILIAVDHLVLKKMKQLHASDNDRSAKPFKIFHMISATCFLVAAFMGMVKPF